MIFDIFFSICQTEVDGYLPSERVMFENFFRQVILADQLGVGTAWVAETHLSCQIQKRNPGSVIPHFIGEIGLNTDILQLAHVIFSKTKNISVGSAIRNIQCNGGPIAHAEAIKTFLTFHSLNKNEKRMLDIGFAAGRFPFSNTPYGVKPRNAFEERAWPVVRGKIFQDCVEIFLRLLSGEILSSKEISPKWVTRADFRSDAEWDEAKKRYAVLFGNSDSQDRILHQPLWVFDTVGVIPFEAPMDLLRLTIGAHDPETQNFANQFLPCGVFNLSITPAKIIEETHQRMKKHFHSKGGAWTRAHMPRTVLVFFDDNSSRAKQFAEKALGTYWKAMEGTLDPVKVEQAVNNALVGDSAQIIDQMQERFDPDDRLMLWFDFNNHDTVAVENSMRNFMQKIAPHVGS